MYNYVLFSWHMQSNNFYGLNLFFLLHSSFLSSLSTREIDVCLFVDDNNNIIFIYLRHTFISLPLNLCNDLITDNNNNYLFQLENKGNNHSWPSVQIARCMYM